MPLLSLIFFWPKSNILLKIFVRIATPLKPLDRILYFILFYVGYTLLMSNIAGISYSINFLEDLEEKYRPNFNILLKQIFLATSRKPLYRIA